jgi:hypothetical protein
MRPRRSSFVDGVHYRCTGLRLSSVRPLLVLVAGLALLLAPAGARGDDAPLDPDRDEFVPLPDVGGNSDIGIEIGASVTFARFRHDKYPYLYRLDAVAETAFKSQNGLSLTQQYDTARLDIPELFSKRLRLDTRIDYVRRVNSLWFGEGNQTVAVPLPASPDPAHDDQYIFQHVRLRPLARIKTGTPFDVALSMNTRYEFPDPYPGSKLAEDLASGAEIGGKAMLLHSVAAGVMVDTRDNEFFPKGGIFYQIGASGTIGSEERVRFGEASATLAHYATLGGPFHFASRMLGSFLFGTIPFYELQQGGVFDPQFLPGGAHGIRGVKLSRYAGRIKVVSNNELRFDPIPRFRILGWKLLVGMTTFFDAGRVWTDYTFSPTKDGRSLGLKWGAGGGLFFQWDTASIVHIDLAYSPDLVASPPLAFYVGNGFLF